MTVVKAAAVQLSPVLYSRKGTVAKVVKTILDLGSRGVEFTTFPETIVSYYPYFSFVHPTSIRRSYFRLTFHRCGVRQGLMAGPIDFQGRFANWKG